MVTIGMNSKTFIQNYGALEVKSILTQLLGAVSIVHWGYLISDEHPQLDSLGQILQLRPPSLQLTRWRSRDIGRYVTSLPVHFDFQGDIRP